MCEAMLCYARLTNKTNGKKPWHKRLFCYFNAFPISAFFSSYCYANTTATQKKYPEGPKGIKKLAA